eukprot:scaffold4159_cov126-Skeletonema_marinoi.AAC.5
MIKLRLRSQSDKQKFPQTQRVKKFRDLFEQNPPQATIDADYSLEATLPSHAAYHFNRCCSPKPQAQIEGKKCRQVD